MIPSTSLLAHSTDPFGGILIDPAALPADAVEFTARLNASVATWRNDGFRLAWLKLPIALSSHVPLAVMQEFVFHHAVPDYVMLTLQLREGASTNGARFSSSSSATTPRIGRISTRCRAA